MILNEKVICPSCGAERSLSQFKLSEEVLEISRLAAKFGKNWAWTEEYLNCFRSSFDKPIKPARMKIILEELLRFIDQQGFNIEKHWFSIRPDALFAAIRHVAQTNKTGFKNHNYLKKVAIDFNLKMIQGDEKEQHKKEEEALRRDPRGPESLKKIIRSLDSPVSSTGQAQSSPE